VVKQCGDCPWKKSSTRTGAMYIDPEKSAGVIGEGFFPQRAAMACHKSKPGKDVPCAGWLNYQLGPGNGLDVRLGIMTGRIETPVVSGAQHTRIEDTFPPEE